jgi:hypothetical protein
VRIDVNAILEAQQANRAAENPGEGYTLEDYRSALFAIPTESHGDYERWRNLGFAIQAAGLPFDDFDMYSARDPNKYGGRAATLKVWNSDRGSHRGIGAGTLIYLAKEHGWTRPLRAVDAARIADEPLALRYQLKPAAAVLQMTPIAWAVKGVLPTQGVAVIFGPSGSGKSLLVLDLLVSVASGVEWCGYRTSARQVVYVGLEGETGNRNRLAVIQLERGSLPDVLHFVLGEPFDLMNPENVTALAAAVAAVCPKTEPLIVVDTLNRAAPGADENSSIDMGRILEGAKNLQRMTGGLVMLVHHTGKDASRGMRGHSSLNAAADAAIEVWREGPRREWRLAKSKDGEDGQAHPFRLEQVSLGTDEDGEAVTSCVVKFDINPTARRLRPLTGANQKLVMSRIGPMFAGGESGKPGAPASALCIPLEVAIRVGGEALTCPPKRRATLARSVISELAARGYLGLHDGWLWEQQ